MEPTETPDPTLRRTLWCVGLVGLVGSVLAGVLGGAPLGIGAGAGASIGLANLALLARSVTRLFAGAGGRYGLVVVFKFVGLILVTYALLRVLQVDALGLALGFGALPLGIVIGGGNLALRNSNP